MTAVVAGVLGLIVGSFLNVCIRRLPQGESVVAPRSRCPACAAPIRALDNIPLLSYLVLRGRCRACRGRISPQYPAVEALTALLFLGALASFGTTPRGLLAAAFLCALIVVTFVDLEHQLIPHAVTLPGIPIGLLGAMLGGDPSLPEALIGCLGGAGFVYLVALYCEVILDREAMGMGDVNLVAMMGAFLGWRALIVAFLAATVSGSVVSLTLIALRRRSRRDPIPFGPFLALGAAVALFLGDALIQWYLGLLRPRG